MIRYMYQMYHLFPLDHTVFSDTFQPKHISKTTRVSLFLSTRVVYYIYIRRCNLTSTVFRYSLFHGSSAFNTEPNPIANAFIFFRPKEEEEQKEANSSPSDTNTNANSEEKDVQSSSSSWSQIKNLLSCKQIEGPRVHEPSKITSSSCGSSLCKFSDVSYGNARVIHRSDHSPESSNLGQDAGLLTRKPVTRGSSSTVISNGCGAYTSYSSSKAMQFRKLSGCYECHMIVDPSRFNILTPHF